MGLNTVRNQDIIFLLLKVKILSDKLKKQYEYLTLQFLLCSHVDGLLN